MTSERFARTMRPPAGQLAAAAVRGGGVTTLLERPDAFEALISPDRADTGLACDWRADNRRRVREQFAEIVDLNGFLEGRRFRPPLLLAALYLTAWHQGSPHWLGLASLRLVTNNGVAYLVDAWQNLVELEDMKFHGTGSGTTAEAAGDSALVTEFTTQLNPNSTRATGTLTEGASANIFRTVATNNYDATVAVTEHGIFNQAATGGGTLWDRSVFSAVNLVSGDSLQTQYDLTVTAGS